MRKAVNQWCFPTGLPLRDVFAVAAAASFDGVELNLSVPGDMGLTLDTTEKEALAIQQLAVDIGLHLPSVSTGLLWEWPLSSPDRTIRARARDIVRQQIALAAALKASTVLVVPGLVNETTSYEECFLRSQEEVRVLAEDAGACGVTIGIENVWNRFLLSPVEMARYVEEIGSAHVGVYFDVGNVLNFGYPDQWIQTLGKRIVKVHVKDFSLQIGNIHGFVPLLSGDVNWPAVVSALRVVGYDDYLTTEIMPYAHDPGRAVQDASTALDVILGM
ncbi:MAG: sugar phosphate isomerase/epimerase [Firmicutes bacterium]|nr:sugar phosphate isomerase/epimerase [Bacillota bacterium]